MLEEIITKVKEHLKDVATLKKSSHSIALGFALGTFIAISPTFGLGPIIGVLLIFIFKKLSKLGLFISFLIWNPIVLISLSPISYGLGKVVLSGATTKTYVLEVLNRLFVYTRIFLIGSLILAVMVSVASYFIVFLLVESYKKRRERKNKNL